MTTEPLTRQDIELILEYASSPSAALQIRPNGMNYEETMRKTRALDRLAAMLEAAPDANDA